MALVPQLGRLSYNGVEFGPYTESTSCSIKPEKDGSGRTVSYNRYTITFRSVISGTNQATTDAVCLRLRQALNKNGGPLIISGRAIGDISVNVSGITDVQNGPWPEELSFQPAVGGALTSILTFRITFCIPECTDAAYKFRPLSFSYLYNIALDELGYTTRTIDLELVIPQNRTTPGSRISQDSADNYVERVTPNLLPGFRRKFGPRQLSKDRSTLTMSIIDEEIKGSIPPLGVVDPQASVSISTTGPGCTNFIVTFNASYMVPKGGNINTAIEAFFDLYKDRSDEFLKMRYPAAFDLSKTSFIPISFNMTEDNVYGSKKISFSLSASIVSDLKTIFEQGGGFFREAPGPNGGSPITWDKWSASLNDTVFNPRGSAQLVFNVGDDRIIDLCDAGAKPKFQEPIAVEKKDIRQGILELKFGTPTPYNSWFMYDNRLRVEQDSGVVSLRSLPTQPVIKATDVDTNTWNALKGVFIDTATDLKNSILQSATSGVFGSVGNNKPKWQIPNNPIAGKIDNNSQAGLTYAVRRTRPQAFIIMEGSATRAGYVIQEPTLETVNGIQVIEVSDPEKGEKFIQQPIFNSPNNVVWYKAVWCKRYTPVSDLPDRPMPLLPNPIFPNAAQANPTLGPVGG